MVVSDTYDNLDERRTLSRAQLESATRLQGRRKSSAEKYSYNDSNSGRLSFTRTSSMDMKDRSYDSDEETYTVSKDDEMDCHYIDSGISNNYFTCGSANTGMFEGSYVSIITKVKAI